MKNILLVLIIIVLGSCAQMNDTHDEFLARGETVYIGRVDSVLTYAGRGSILMQYWISDPRAKFVTVSWGVFSTDTTLVVTPRAAGEPLELLLSIQDDNVAEGSHTFRWVTSDDHGNKSMVFENIGTLYGDMYQERLLNRRVNLAEITDDDDIDVSWAGANSADEIGVEVFYVERSTGENKTLFLSNPANTPLLTDVEYEHGVTYRTLFKPTPTAIDTFYTNTICLGASKIQNVALGKPVTGTPSNDPAADNQKVENAVDGNRLIGNAGTGRFVSTNNGPWWIEIDLQGEYTINGFALWNGNNNYNDNRITSFDFQVWEDDGDGDGEWVPVVEVRNGDYPTPPAAGPTYSNNNFSATTTKVRFYIRDTGARIFELEVYSIIRYCP